MRCAWASARRAAWIPAPARSCAHPRPASVLIDHRPRQDRQQRAHRRLARRIGRQPLAVRREQVMLAIGAEHDRADTAVGAVGDGDASREIVGGRNFMRRRGLRSAKFSALLSWPSAPSLWRRGRHQQHANRPERACRPARGFVSGVPRQRSPRRQSGELLFEMNIPILGAADRLRPWNPRRPIITVWVIPAKGAALNETIPAIATIKAKPRVARSSAPAWSDSRISLGGSPAAQPSPSSTEARPDRPRVTQRPAGARRLLRSRAGRRGFRRRLAARAKNAGRLLLISSDVSAASTRNRARKARWCWRSLPTIRRPSRTAWSFSAGSVCRLNGFRRRQHVRREPRLAGKIAGALFSLEDHQVDNRKLAQALRVAAEAAVSEIRRASALSKTPGQAQRRRAR